MRKLFLGAALLLAACGGNGSGVTKNVTVIDNGLRAPAYPLITIDTYTNGWSAADHLYDEPVKHWTGKDFPLMGVLTVDGTAYRFMGAEQRDMRVVVPTSQQGAWEGRFTTVEPAADWTSPGFDDAGWQSSAGAFGTTINEPTAKTNWETERIWVRRTVVLEEDPAGREMFLEYSDDDQAVFSINGVEVHDSGFMVHQNRLVKLPAEVVATLKKGENFIAASCYNPHGNGLLDFGLLTPREETSRFGRTAVQTSVNVEPTQTHYTFDCGGVELKLTFTAPLLMDDLELISRPVNYITYSVSARDGAAHEMEIYFEASPRWALDVPYQESVSETFEEGGLVFVKSGSKEQNVLGKKGDDVRIDWGYFYMAAEKESTTASVDESAGTKLAIVRTLGSTDRATGKIMIGYDDIYSIQYFGTNLRPYWNRKGDKTITGQFRLANEQYASLMERCYAFDYELMTDATRVGGKKYAELCALAYRHSISAHKLVESPEGELLWFSKENNSNGSIGTVDITYPASPLYLYYNAELAKGSMNHIFHYAESGRWTKPFPAHDVGTYPIANGQTYGGDMPIEEAGNMVILAAAVAAVEGNALYAEKHWDTLTTWADYLAENGLDPENQLCTDDFAGHFAHNVNLSVKAIMGVACYGRMAEMLGKTDVAEKYTAKAREMADRWMTMADDGDHYRLTFDKPGTWSQKYNLVWNKLLKLEIFPDDVARKEVAYYPGKQNTYGLPLDNRETYAKTDWIVWTATLADDRAGFEAFIDPMWKFQNETTDRVPMPDWIWTDKPVHRGFKARPVVGGYWIKMLEEKLNEK